MDFKFRRVATFFTLTTLIISLTACAGSRKFQCRKLMEVVDQGNMAIAAQDQKTSGAATIKLAQELNTIADQMEDLYLTNGRLKKIREGFTEVFREFATALNEMGQALEAAEKSPISVEGRTKLVQEIDKVNQVSKRTLPLSQKAETLMAEMEKRCPPESLQPEEPEPENDNSK
ncbi:MAG: hypothetical protein AAFO04_14440 [Cyanobacteria bacterium J06592_8]